MEALFTLVYSKLNHHGEKFFDIILPLKVSPNNISVFRALLAIPVNVLFVYGFYGWSIGLYIFSGVLDFVDGVLARARKQTTELGKYIDAMCDKFFISATGGFLVLDFCFKPMPFFVLKGIGPAFLLLIFYEVILARKRTGDYLAVLSNPNEQRDLAANNWGKMKMCAEVLGVGFLFLTPYNIWFALVPFVLFPASIILAIQSFKKKR